MKKIFFLTSLLYFAATVESAAQYRINKEQYDFRTYKKESGDPYNAFAAGLVSYYIPGLGHMILNEAPRGFRFLGGYATGWLVVGSGWVVYNTNATNTFSIEFNDPGIGLMLLGFSGLIVVEVWSVIDAVRVAKVNNLAWRDRVNKPVSSIGFAPVISLSPGYKVIPGISATIRF